MPRFEPNRASLNSHSVPAWFDDGKLGIFIHWGLFSVPAFAPRLSHVSEAFTKHYPLGAVMTPYTEWYDNAIRVAESPSARHHREVWNDRPYAAFREPFESGLEEWDPTAWAQLFRRAGARYVVLVTKHHDGFCLWPTQVTNPQRPGWNSQRDVVGELAAAVRGEGMRFGIYYSGGVDWSFNPTPVRTLVQFIGSIPGGDYASYAERQVRELIERYQPSVLWNDIAWPSGERAMLQLIADYYQAVPHGVVNDRWMHRTLPLRLIGLTAVQRLIDFLLERRIRRAAARGEHDTGIVPPPPVHYDFRTPEYTTFDEIKKRKWETTRGMSPSFGYNREDREEHYEDPIELIRSFVDTVAKNGNLLLNVGPRGEDAGIPDPQRQRLEMLGTWLAANGEAIYGTRPWVAAESETDEGIAVRFTAKEETLYAVVLGTPKGAEFSFRQPGRLADPPTARHLAAGVDVGASMNGDRLRLRLDRALAEQPAHAFALALASTPASGMTKRHLEGKTK